MAGGKESPRQKMIGMMYLVLTALLALNVTKTVLDKFVFINKSLERSVSDAVVKNNGTVERVKSAVDESGNRPADLAVLDKAQEVREKTTEVLQSLTQLKEEIIVLTGGRDEEGKFVEIADEEKLANLMLNQGRGEELKKRLNDYTAYLSQTIGTSFSPIALDAKDSPEFKDNPDQKRKTFSELNFANTPMAAGLATISQLQTEVVNKESQALDELARKVGAADLKFDKIIAMVRPESKVVAAGTKYSAEMFIAASSSGVMPTMKRDGQPIPVDASGMGKVEFTATPGDYDKNGNAIKSYVAAITMKMPGGNDTTFTQKVEYVVAKPVIQVQSQSVQALYYNCANELNVQVPALGSVYDPSFTASNASTIKGQQRGLVTIVPTSAADVKLNVINSGNLIGSETFKVRPIPKPEIKVLNGNAEINAKQGESIARLRTLNVKAVAEEGFAQFLPKDARYRVSEWTVTLARGSRPVAPPINATSESVNIASFASVAKPGDRIVVEIKKVQRMNFKGAIENVGIKESFVNIPLN